MITEQDHRTREIRQTLAIEVLMVSTLNGEVSTHRYNNNNNGNF